MAQVSVKYRVHCYESERGWSSEHYHVHCYESERGWSSEHYHVDFDTREEAQKYWDELELKFGGKSVVPDYYCIPKRIELIEV